MPSVVVTSTDGASTAEIEAVRNALAGEFDINEDASPDTALRVMVGRTVPQQPSDGLTFVVAPPPDPDAPEIRRVSVSNEVSVNAIGRVVVDLALPVTQASRDVAISLTADDVPVETITRTVAPGASTLSAELLMVPARLGLARLRVSARVGNGPVSIADVATEVTRRTLRVLSYEARPSWAATFVRRSLEQDPRIEVVVRSMTSRGVGADAGTPPMTLERAEDLTEFDVVIVSAPEALSDRAAVALEQYVRVREGAVVLLPGEVESTVATRLTGVNNWVVDRRPALTKIDGPGGAWTASEFVWPSVWPAGAEGVSSCLSPGRCAVWKTYVGGGRVIVSSALDGWRTRGADDSSFDAFWREVVGNEATSTPRPLEVGLRSRMVTPDGLVTADVRVLDPAAVPAAEWHNTEGRVEPVRLWPFETRTYRAAFRAPAVPGRYRLVVKTAGTSPQEARSEFLVVEEGTTHTPLPAGHTMLAAFASSRGGAVVPMSQLADLPARIRAALPASTTDTPVNPMRSPFWMIPFAGLLATEWWARRRRGAR